MSLAVLQQAAFLSSQRSNAVTSAQRDTTTEDGASSINGTIATTAHHNNGLLVNMNEHSYHTSNGCQLLAPNAGGGGASRVPSSGGGNTTSTIVVTEQDVLCGRGGETNHHPGNVAYRTLVKTHQPLYIKAKRRDKPKIARAIVDTIMLQYGGRFLKRASSCDEDVNQLDPSSSTSTQQQQQWVEISVQKAREKTSQALRENAPNLRNKEQEQILMAQREKQYQTDQRIELQLQQEKTARMVMAEQRQQHVVAAAAAAKRQAEHEAAASAAAAGGGRGGSSPASLLLARAQHQSVVDPSTSQSTTTTTSSSTAQQKQIAPSYYFQSHALSRGDASAPAHRDNRASSSSHSHSSKQDGANNTYSTGRLVAGSMSDVTLPSTTGNGTTDFVLRGGHTNTTGDSVTTHTTTRSNTTAAVEEDMNALAVANLIRANVSRYGLSSSGSTTTSSTDVLGTTRNSSTLSHLLAHASTKASASQQYLSNISDGTSRSSNVSTSTSSNTTSPVKALLYEHLYGRIANNNTGNASNTSSNSAISQHPFYHNHAGHFTKQRHYDLETIALNRDYKGPWTKGPLKDTLTRSHLAHQFPRSAGTIYEPVTHTDTSSTCRKFYHDVVRCSSSSDNYLLSRHTSDVNNMRYPVVDGNKSYPKDVVSAEQQSKGRTNNNNSSGDCPRSNSHSTSTSSTSADPTTSTSTSTSTGGVLLTSRNPANHIEGDEAIAAAAFLQLFNGASAGTTGCIGSSSNAANRSSDEENDNHHHHGMKHELPKRTGHATSLLPRTHEVTSSTATTVYNDKVVAPISPTSDTSRSTSTSSTGMVRSGSAASDAGLSSGDEAAASTAPSAVATQASKKGSRGVGPRLKRFKRRLEEQQEDSSSNITTSSSLQMQENAAVSPKKIRQQLYPPQLPYHSSQ